MIMMHTQINRAINASISDRVDPEIHKTLGNLTLGQTDTGPGTSLIDQGLNDKPNVLNA